MFSRIHSESHPGLVFLGGKVLKYKFTFLNRYRKYSGNLSLLEWALAVLFFLLLIFYWSIVDGSLCLGRNFSVSSKFHLNCQVCSQYLFEDLTSHWWLNTVYFISLLSMTFPLILAYSILLYSISGSFIQPNYCFLDPQSPPYSHPLWILSYFYNFSFSQFLISNF